MRTRCTGIPHHGVMNARTKSSVRSGASPRIWGHGDGLRTSRIPSGAARAMRWQSDLEGLQALAAVLVDLETLETTEMLKHWNLVGVPHVFLFLTARFRLKNGDKT
eukprot:1845322-Amphidinium_carterae.1